MGDISPCCKFRTSKYNNVYNIQTDSFDNYLDSDFLKQVKHDLTNNKWPTGCERCQIEEDNNIESKRMLDYTRWGQQYNNYDLASNKCITASISFGNTCNLKCITCNPGPSSRWQKEYNDLFGVNVKNFKFYKKDFVQKFVELAPEIIHIDITGGEPMLGGVDEQIALLRYYIDSGQAENITLHYTTNALLYPSDELWTLWKQFKEIDLQVSIDGIRCRYEYIRFPGNWQDLLANVQKFIAVDLHNFKLSVSHTVSAYNIYYLDEFCTWSKQIGLPDPWLGRVHDPFYMRPTIWPEPFKTQLINKLKNSNHPAVQNWATLIANVDDSEHYNMFCNMLRKHDQYRKTTFENVFPEISKWVKK